jgi:hypothetical protein
MEGVKAQEEAASSNIRQATMNAGFRAQGEVASGYRRRWVKGVRYLADPLYLV